MAIDDSLRDLRARTDAVVAGGGEARVQAQHGKGKLTARERLDLLLDPGSFHELGALMTHRAVDFGMNGKEAPGDGVVTGYGTVDGRLVFVFSQDFTVLGGSLGEAHAAKITAVMDRALKVGAPLIGINDSGGARIQEGVDALKGYGEIFYRNTMASGVIPQITVIMGPCAGGAVYSPALGDFIFMTERTSFMFITGPQVVKTVLSQDVSAEELGGAGVHQSRTGLAHRVGQDDAETLHMVRELLGFLPANTLEAPPVRPLTDSHDRETHDLYSIIPQDPAKGYDVAEVIRAVADDRSFFELQPNFARNLVIGFARLDGMPVGIVANNPGHLSGVLDIDTSDKGSRFVRFCDAFNIPVITFVDTPGYMPGTDQEHAGIIRHGAKILYAYSEATVPLATVIVRKAYGGAYIAMASKHLRSDLVLALPTAEIAVMGPKGACEVVFRREIAGAEDPEQRVEELVKDYRDTFANPYMAASRGYVDEVVDPKNLRAELVNFLRVHGSKREKLPNKKHGVMPT